ncbi:MAG: cytochrome c oxidase assembly protein [Rickettsiaceae bacterium]|nr:cytochrome c oxidase assembly protein [Rickettsiaceae bacterium]
MQDRKGDANLVLSLIFLMTSMLFLSFASSAIYNIFCKVTGTGGVVSVAPTSSSVKGFRNIIVRFDSNIEKDLEWKFYPKQDTVQITTGENNLVFYEAINASDKNTIGTAVYNVTPQKAGKYFNKIECFCFKEQLLKAKQRILMPVSFYIDASFDSDPEMRDVKEITLSYTFFKIKEIN